jgi:hypothetical protein
MNHRKTFVFIAIVCLIVSSIVFAGGIPEPNNPNLNNDDRVDFIDFGIFADNWQQLGNGLAGDFDDSGTVDIDDLMMFCWYWLSEYSEYQQCQRVDIDGDGIIAFEDLAIFAQNWLLSGQGLAGDFDTSNLVDYNDLSVLTDCWLKGSRPETVFEQFKAALAAGDVNTTLTFIAETSRDRYAEIFQIIEPDLPAFAAGIGNLILKTESEVEGEVKYEMTHQVGAETYLFPIIFIKDEQGSWKIDNF